MPNQGDPRENYLHGHHESVLRSHRWRTAENSAGYLLPRLSRNAFVLDVGCGPGTITLGLANAVPQGYVVGLDVEFGVIDEAVSRRRSSGAKNVSFNLGDVYRLPFLEHSFDVVYAHQLLQHLQDPVAALQEMRRVCRNQGLVAARDADYGAMFWYPASTELSEWQALYHAVAKSTGGEPDAGRHLYPWALRAGFSSVEPSATTWCFSDPEERSWWGGLWAERLTRSRFAALATSSRLARPTDLERLAEGWKKWASAKDACFFVVHKELLCIP